MSLDFAVIAQRHRDAAGFAIVDGRPIVYDAVVYYDQTSSDVFHIISSHTRREDALLACDNQRRYGDAHLRRCGVLPRFADTPAV